MTLKPFARFFPDSIYRVSYFVVCSKPERFLTDVRRLLRAHAPKRDERAAILTALEASIRPDWGDCRGTCFRLTPPVGDDILPCIVIWLKPGTDVGVLVHEAWHALQSVFARRGVRFDDGEGANEPTAYYLEWIVQKALGLR